MGRPRIQHQVIDGVEHKRCGCCKTWLPLQSFNQLKKNWDGLQFTCRNCQAQQQAAHRVANLEHVRERDAGYAAARRAADPVGTAAQLVAWKKANPDKVREYARKTAARRKAADPEKFRAEANERAARWREAHPELARAAYRAFRTNNVDRFREQAVRASAKRRALKQALPNERWTEQQVIDRDGMTCWMCSKSVGYVLPSGVRDWHIDHLIPLSLADYPDHPGDVAVNLAIACFSCNSWKRARLLPEAIARYLSNVEAAAA